jgi:hypothetical protein
MKDKMRIETWTVTTFHISVQRERSWRSSSSCHHQTVEKNSLFVGLLGSPKWRKRRVVFLERLFQRVCVSAYDTSLHAQPKHKIMKLHWEWQITLMACTNLHKGMYNADSEWLGSIIVSWEYHSSFRFQNMMSLQQTMIIEVYKCSQQSFWTTMVDAADEWMPLIRLCIRQLTATVARMYRKNILLLPLAASGRDGVLLIA